MRFEQRTDRPLNVLLFLTRSLLPSFESATPGLENGIIFIVSK